MQGKMIKLKQQLVKVNVEFILPSYLNSREEVASYINKHLKNNNNLKYVMLIESDVESFNQQPERI